LSVDQKLISYNLGGSPQGLVFDHIDLINQVTMNMVTFVPLIDKHSDLLPKGELV